MEIQEFSEKIKKQTDQIGIEITKMQIEQFYKYMELLINWNSKMNLTAITDPDEVILKHFIDSITINKYINNSSKVIDIGTGAGFPGLPLKIMNNASEVVLLDSLNKRINFLNEVIKENKLEKISAIHGRAEEMAQSNKYRETFDIACSRAVAPLRILLEYMLPFVKIGGVCICMKGTNLEEELESAKNAIKALGGKLENIEEFELPNSDMKRTVIIIKKEKNTPEKYPRKAGTPSKEPL